MEQIEVEEPSLLELQNKLHNIALGEADIGLRPLRGFEQLLELKELGIHGELTREKNLSAKRRRETIYIYLYKEKERAVSYDLEALERLIA